MISTIQLKRIIEEQQEEVKHAKIKPREIIPELEASMDLEEITILTGARRSGKTYLMYHLAQKYDGIYINFEDERLIGFDVKDFEKLHYLIGEKPLLMDEVQNVEGWEKFARRVHRKNKVIVSGSNVQLLNSEFATALTGRTLTFQVFPLSYKEFLSFKGLSPSVSSFENYLDIGGFPRIVETGKKEFIREYFEMILYRDVVPRFNIKHIGALRTLALYLLSNVGKPFSYRSLLQITGMKHEMTIKNYVQYLESSYLIFTLYKYHPSFKTRERSPKKAYTVDPLFPTLGTPDISIRSRLLENIIYIHLIKQYGKENVYYYQDKQEIDFLIAQKLQPSIAMNVSYSITDKKTFNREINALLRLNPKIKKYLITLYPLNFDLPDGINYISAIDLLTKHSKL